MNVIEAVGAYKFTPLESMVNVTSGGFPQLVIKARVSAVYDEDNAVWNDTVADDADCEHPWSEYDIQTTIYLVLCNTEKRFLNYEQAMAAFGWDGQSFGGLSDMDLTGTEFLGIVRENEYEGKTTLRVEWIGNKDSDPVRTLKPLDAAGLKNIDAAFAGVKPGKTVAPAKAPAKAPGKPASPKPPAAPKPPVAPAAKPPAAPAADPTPAPDAETDTPETTAPPAPPVPPTTKGKAKGKGKKPPAAATRPFGVDGMSKDDAFAKVFELKKPSVTGEHMSDTWCEACTIIAGDPEVAEEDRFAAIDDSTITPEQWRDIAAKTLDILPDSLKF